MKKKIDKELARLKLELNLIAKAIRTEKQMKWNTKTVYDSNERINYDSCDL